jgi:xanthine dehydrogenase accessory factor
VGGFTVERLLHVEASGIFNTHNTIGDTVKKGDVVAECTGVPIKAQIDGVLRGILHDGIFVEAGTKCGDIDPRCDVSACFTVSDKALSVAGGVLEAILMLLQKWKDT